MQGRLALFSCFCEGGCKLRVNKMARLLGLFFIQIFLLSAGVFAHEKIKSLPVTLEGRASITPDNGIAGQFGSWTISYEAGRQGIKTGGGIKIELPDAWYAGLRNSTTRLQTSDPADNNYITANISNSGVTVQTIVEGEEKALLPKWDRPSLDDRTERYVFVVRVVVKKGRVKKGDVISVVFGDRTGGSAGYLAGAIATPPQPVMIALDRNGNNKFKLLKILPKLTIHPGVARYMQVILPSQAVVGKSLKGRISLVDGNANAVNHTAVFRLYQKTGRAIFPAAVKMMPNRGYVEFSVTPRQTGVLRLRVRSGNFPLEAISNPVVVTKAEPEEKIYWGDIHSHTHFSWDGVGDQNFYYARFIAGLDFYAMSDHSFAPRSKEEQAKGRGKFGSFAPAQSVESGKELAQEVKLSRGLNKSTWAKYSALTDRKNDPGHFVTLLAYEDSMGVPYGHRNVYFRDKPAVLAYPGRTSLPQLWNMLERGNALTIPHHTGKMPVGIDFSIHNKDFERNIEIYSGHGLSEEYDPDNPLAFEHILFSSDARSVKPSYGQYAQDAWKKGLKLSTIASSDNHHSHPGQPQYGLTAVRGSALDRNDIFQGLYNRQTYGTTGARIILDFHVDDVAMGQTGIVSMTPAIKINIVGTDEIDWVELLRYQEGDQDFNVIKRWQPMAWEADIVYRDDSHKPGAIYYYRVRQKYKIRGRAVMAWSSPIWTVK